MGQRNYVSSLTNVIFIFFLGDTMLFHELCIFVILILLSYKKVAYPISLIATIVYSCSILLMTIFITTDALMLKLIDILGSPNAQIYFLVFLRIAVASVVSYIFFKDKTKFFLLSVFLTALVSIYTREWGWMK